MTGGSGDRNRSEVHPLSPVPASRAWTRPYSDIWGPLSSRFRRYTRPPATTGRPYLGLAWLSAGADGSASQAVVGASSNPWGSTTYPSLAGLRRPTGQAASGRGAGPHPDHPGDPVGLSVSAAVSASVGVGESVGDGEPVGDVPRVSVSDGAAVRQPATAVAVAAPSSARRDRRERGGIRPCQPDTGKCVVDRTAR